MECKLIAGKTIDEWKTEYPLLNQIMQAEEVFWPNPSYDRFENVEKRLPLSKKDVTEAEDRLNRFAPYIAAVFPETRETQGIIESSLVPVAGMQEKIDVLLEKNIKGRLFAKCDSHLPISGSIKARGGIYAVLKHAEDLAIKHKMLTIDADYAILTGEKFRQFLSEYSLAVGSTGNLGLSIGIMGAQLGFKIFVHMSANAKKWKKDLLREKGVVVIEYESDYSKAVVEGRKQAENDPGMYFIDDENSVDLFLGYAVAANRLKKQMDEAGIIVDAAHPLFAWLPCGVGGAPGGITFGLKLAFKDHVHCFFAEPTHAPCMLLGLMTQQHDRVSVQDFGLDNITDADGLAVGRSSAFVGKTLEKLISGVYTVKDDHLYRLLCALADTEKIYAEPSALAGFPGPAQLFNTREGIQYIKDRQLENAINNGTHIAWVTGGNMVPASVMDGYYQKGLKL